MVTRIRKFIPDVSIGNYVVLLTPDVDRGPTGPPNIICRIVDIIWDTQVYLNHNLLETVLTN